MLDNWLPKVYNGYNELDKEYRPVTKIKLENQGFRWSDLAKYYFRKQRFMRYKFYQRRAKFYFDLALEA